MTSRRVRGLVAGAMAGALMLTIFGTGAATAATPSGVLSDWTKNTRLVSSDALFAAARTNGIWLYGDSITTRDSGALGRQLATAANGNLTTAVDATAGMPTAPAVDRLQARVAAQGPPKVLVMATGTNDIFATNAFAAQVNRVRRVVGPDTHVIWVDVWVRRTSKSPTVQIWDARNSWRVNQLIARGNVDTVVGWAAFLAAKPSRPAAYLVDGVHPNAAGQAARNALITRSVVAAHRS